MKPGDLIKLKEGPVQIQEKNGEGIFKRTNGDISYDFYSIKTVTIPENTFVLLLEVPKSPITNNKESLSVKILVKDKICFIEMSYLDII